MGNYFARFGRHFCALPLLPKHIRRACRIHRLTSSPTALHATSSSQHLRPLHQPRPTRLPPPFSRTKNAAGSLRRPFVEKWMSGPGLSLSAVEPAYPKAKPYLKMRSLLNDKPLPNRAAAVRPDLPTGRRRWACPENRSACPSRPRGAARGRGYPPPPRCRAGRG